MHIPLRMCVACRSHKPKSELIRLGIDAGTGKVIRREGMSHDGRGVYICKNADCIRRAEKKRTAERMLRAEAGVGLYDIPEDMI